MKRITMRHLGFGLLALAVFLMPAATSWGANTLVAVSDTINPAQIRCTVFVKVANDVILKNIVYPFVIREVTAGCIPDSVLVKRNERLVDKLTQISILEQKGDALGNCKQATPGGFTGTPKYAFGSADTLVTMDGPAEGFLISIGIITDAGNQLAIGSDVTGSILMVLRTPATQGSFEVDTTCTDPANHLQFVGSNNAKIVPAWTKSTMHIGTPSAVQYLGGDGVPRDYSLDQNYPNPFNASTVIRFNTKHDGHVRLEVFNILGQKVTTLVNEFRHFGPQAADWDGTDVNGASVPTGLYFYRLVTSDYTDVKKMVLLK
ncbi:MAG: T9SS type A sorting domain-containing protein [candidate division Zixibacteria bacterium]|nr:T9SS type A sorting domain-containing protein [candidate division Zixibacteria bacterium]